MKRRAKVEKKTGGGDYLISVRKESERRTKSRIQGRKREFAQNFVEQKKEKTSERMATNQVACLRIRKKIPPLAWKKVQKTRCTVITGRSTCALSARD